MVAVKTGFSSPSMPGMPAPMQPMGGMPPMPPMGGGALAPNPFAPLPPMPLAGMPPPPMQPPMARPPMPQQAPQQQQQGSNAPRRKRFGDSLESMLGRNQGLGATAQQRPLPMPPQMMPRQQMVAPGTPMMRTPTPRPMNQGGEVDIFGYEDGGSVQYFDEGGHAHPHSDVANSYIENMLAGRDDLSPLEKLDFANTLAADFGVEGGVGHTAAINNVLDIALDINAGLNDQQMLDYLTAAGDASGTYETGLIDSLTSNISAAAPAPAPAPVPEPVLSQILPDPPAAPVAQPYDPDRTIAVGSNSDIDDAFNSGDVVLKDVTIKDGIYMMPDGVTPVTYAAGFPIPTAASTPAPATTGINAGPGTAVGAPANFGTGAYTPAPVDPSEVNPIDYTQLTGDIGNFSGTPESSALFGPKINIPQSVSQYYTDPATGGLTTTYGPEMVATSPIGAIKLPARPVDIDIFDFLSSPTYGTMYSGSGETRETCAAKGMGYNSILKVCVPMSGDASYGTGSELNTGFLSAPQPMAMGGAVPRQTSIAGQPHGLAYINQDEEALLRSFGGSGIAGPGGIPSYPPRGVTSGGGASDAPKTFDSGYKPITTNYKDDDDDDDNSSDKMSFGDDDYTPTSAELNQDLANQGLTNITTNFSNVNYDKTGSGKDYDTAAQADTDVSGFEYVAAGGLGTGDSGTPTNIAPISLGSDDPVVFTDIMGNTYSNAADRDRANLGYQQASYQQGSQALRGTLQGFKEFGDFDSDEEAYRRGAANFAVDPPENVSVYNLQNTPDIFSNMFNQPIMPPISPPKIGGGDDKDDSDLDKASKYNNMLALERDFAPGEGGYSLVDLKERVSLAEGTSDAGGYDRLLGGQEKNRFKIKPTEMTVQEILDFQSKRGAGSYAEYANSEVGRISTPVGKYQIVGSTLQGLVDQGILDPNEKFNENAQERAGTHLITKDLFKGKGLQDLKTGDMTINEFETALGKQFEGIELGLDKKAIPTIKDTESSIIPASNTTSTSEEVNIFDPDNKKIVPPTTGGSDTDKELPTFIPAKKVEQITSYTDKDGKTTVDDPDTKDINEAVIAQLGLGSSLADVTATGRDIGVPNAAESAFLMEALNEMEFDDKGNLVGAEPNFLEETVGKVIKNLTLGAFDPNDPQKREDALAILDNYKKTGKFVYDGKEMSITDLIKASKEEGIEPAVIGVEGADGSTVGFDDGTGFRNIMGDYNPVYKDGQVFSGGSDTQNILTGSTNVFEGNTNTGNTATEITTGGGDDGGSDGGDDVDTGHTVDEDGNKVCNTEGYVYNPETKICEPKKEEEVDGTPGSGIGTGTSGESFDDVLKRVVMAAPDVAPISANVKPMQEGGMAGLNRAADNFLQALAG